jgi:hypothetical protein
LELMGGAPKPPAAAAPAPDLEAAARDAETKAQQAAELDRKNRGRASTILGGADDENAAGKSAGRAKILLGA